MCLFVIYVRMLSVTDYIVSNGRMISEERIGKDVEGSIMG
jgi:hypothetical protein